jgi:hypothetical protein
LAPFVGRTTADLGTIRGKATASEPYLAFDRGLLLRAEVLGQSVVLALDTGAGTTDLNENFATQFGSVAERGKRTTQDITGVGGTRTFDALELPEVAFTIGSKQVFLRPATITLQRVVQIGGECCVGNAGRDLLVQQSLSVTIDLRPPKRVLALPDLEHAKMAVLNSLTSASGQRTYDHAIREFVAWYCSEPRLAFNRTVVLRYRIYLEQRGYAPAFGSLPSDASRTRRPTAAC